MKEQSNEKHVSSEHNSGMPLCLRRGDINSPGQGQGTGLVGGQSSIPRGAYEQSSDTRDSHGPAGERLREVHSSALPAAQLDRFAKTPAFDHAAAISQLKTLHSDAQIGLRKVVALGLFCFELKEIHLKHGQFGPWLQECAPEFCKLHSRSKSPHPSSALASCMKLTENVLKGCGVSVKTAIAKLSTYHYNISPSNPRRTGICHCGEILLLDDAQVPEASKSLRDKICNLVDGKTAKQLCFGFKQIEEDEAGNHKVKVGRLKGQGGASHAQRVAAAAVEKLADKVAKEAAIKGFQVWIKKHCVDTAEGIGLIVSDAALVSLNDWSKVAFDYTSRILSARTKGHAK